MFAKTTPEATPGFTNVKNGRASVTGYHAVHKITGLAGEMATDRKRVPYDRKLTMHFINAILQNSR